MDPGRLARISHGEMTPAALGRSDAASRPVGRADLGIAHVRRFPSLDGS